MEEESSIKKIMYNGSFYKDVSLSLSTEAVENLAVYVKELQNPFMAILGYPSLARSEGLGMMFPSISKEYRVKGTLKGESLDLLVEGIDYTIDYAASQRKYIPLTADEKVEECIKAYLKEMAAFKGKIVSKEEIQKAAQSWKKDLKMSDKALEVLVNSVEGKIVQYRTRENKFFYVPYLEFFGALAGQFISVGFGGGQKYQRRISPILGLPPFNVLNNLARYLRYKNPAPIDVVFENPKKVGIVLPPVVGLFAKQHETRHALEYAAFSELINPHSALFSEHTKEEAKSKAYANLAELIANHFSPLPFLDFTTHNKKVATEIFLKKMPAGILVDAWKKDLLENEEARGIIAGVLFTSAYGHNRRAYESIASSLKGNKNILALPWIVPLALYGFQSPYGFQYFSAIAGNAVLLNILLMMGGYGDLLSYHNVKDLLHYADSPEKELKVIARVGPRILETEVSPRSPQSP